MPLPPSKVPRPLRTPNVTELEAPVSPELLFRTLKGHLDPRLGTTAILLTN